MWSGRKRSNNLLIRHDLDHLKILLLNQFYPPDIAPTGVKLHDLARHLVADEHNVTVLASKVNYNGNEYFQREYF